MLEQKHSDISERVIEDNKMPLVSIVLLTKNAGDLFKESLEMIFSQIAQFSYEVVAVDSGSRDGTLELLKSYPIRIFEIDPKSFSFGPTRDFAFEKASGKYIATISQDVTPSDRYWLQNLITPLINNDADLVQGHLTIPKEKRVFFWERSGWFYFTSDKTDFCKNYGDIGLSCTNLAVKKDVWQKVKFGDIAMSEDKMFQKKLYEHGYKMVRRKEALAFHGHIYNVWSLIRRCENEGFGWKCVGVKYTFLQMLKDLIPKKRMLIEMRYGIGAGNLTTLAELLFVFIRPISLYKGNLLNKKYKFPD